MLMLHTYYSSPFTKTNRWLQALYGKKKQKNGTVTGDFFCFFILRTLLLERHIALLSVLVLTVLEANSQRESCSILCKSRIVDMQPLLFEITLFYQFFFFWSLFFINMNAFWLFYWQLIWLVATQFISNLQIKGTVESLLDQVPL